MKPCDEMIELISLRIDGALTPEEARRLDDHLSRCEACRAELAETERVWLALGALAEPEAPAGLAERIARRAAAPRRRLFSPWAWGVTGAVAAAAITVVVALESLPSEKQLDAETKQIVTNIDLIQNLDVLEHLETVEQLGDGVLLLTEDQAKSGGES